MYIPAESRAKEIFLIFSPFDTLFAVYNKIIYSIMVSVCNSSVDWLSNSIKSKFIEFHKVTNKGQPFDDRWLKVNAFFFHTRICVLVWVHRRLKSILCRLNGFCHVLSDWKCKSIAYLKKKTAIESVVLDAACSWLHRFGIKVALIVRELIVIKA